MAKNFAFDARQFYDFSQSGNEEDQDVTLESYFEREHETHEVTANIDECIVHNESEEEGIFFSTVESTPEIGNDQMFLRSKMRRSISVGNIPMSKPAEKDINEFCNNFNSLDISEVKKYNQKNTSTASLNNAPLKLNKLPVRSISRDNLNRLAQPKRKYCSEEQLNQNKFVSMAEQINKFSQSTPDRYRSRPTLKVSKIVAGQLTIPQSPRLNSKNRIRPPTVLSKEEQEQKDMEDAKRFKIRAQPVNKKILQGPMKLPTNIEKKQPTVVEPFKITTISKKPAVSPKREVFKFESNPLPKSTYQPYKPIVMKKKCTVPQTPNFSKRFAKISSKDDKPEYKQEPKDVNKLSVTQPMPFSFEAREQLLIQKRKDFVNKVFEEEKKAREFHARPVPKGLLRSKSVNSELDSNLSTGSHKSDEHLSTVTSFKAKPAKVLHIKPFEPKRPEHPLTEIVEFNLNTDRRAKEREEFDNKVKMKTELSMKLKQKEVRDTLLLEEQERVRLRKEAEYKAQPIKKYKEIKIIPSNKITVPITPKLHTVKSRNKENVDQNN